VPLSSLLRTFIVVAIGALVYYGLLSFIYSEAPYSSMPRWWLVHANSKRGVIISWFTLLNVLSAVLSAIPVAFGLVFISKVHRIGSAIVVGALVALLIGIGGFSEYGLPDSGGKWLVNLAPLVSIGGAVVGVVAVIVRLPSNTSLERTRER
jgi:hypothetical protein